MKRERIKMILRFLLKKIQQWILKLLKEIRIIKKKVKKKLETKRGRRVINKR